MKQIQMVDLLNQYLSIKDDVDQAMQEVIMQSSFIKGKDVKQFENELAAYLGVKHVIACANGTDALQIALMALDLSLGDEIITPDFTFISTVEVNALLGLKPLLSDVDPRYFTLDPADIETMITPKTRAIIPVHLFGQCAPMEEIIAIAKKHNLTIIEDAAQALGAEYTFKNGEKKKAGTLGDIGTTSFFPSKNLGAFGDGGAIFTNNDDLATKMRGIANHGMKVKYYHDYVGINSRLDTLQAALLRVKLRYLDQYHLARQKAAKYYDEAFRNNENIVIPERNPSSNHIFHQYTLLIKNGLRNQLKEYLAENNIPSMVYYPVPMHKQIAYEYLNYSDDSLPVSTRLCSEVLSLPMHTELDEEQLAYITEKVNRFFD